MKSLDELTATDLAQMFVTLARQESMRVGYRRGVQHGSGVIPFDTGALQRTIRVVRGGTNTAQVNIGNESVFYAKFLEFGATLQNGAPNMHRGFVERFVADKFAQYLSSQLGVAVQVTIKGDN
ncbi:MAG: HK97 gp10 family phage protein [Clostridiales bacterium]|nr:HK97 gp10 family phage protein [Clostridiales bacterium]